MAPANSKQQTSVLDVVVDREFNQVIDRIVSRQSPRMRTLQNECFTTYTPFLCENIMHRDGHTENITRKRSVCSVYTVQCARC